MTGTLVNTGAVVVGGVAGTLLGGRLPDRVRSVVMQGIGLVTLVIGMSLALETGNVLIVLGSILIGGLLGEWWRLDQRLAHIGDRLEKGLSRWPALTRGEFSRGFITASLVFCIGPMTILGSLQDGMTGDYHLLAVKSLLDCFAALAFSATMGIGVAFAAVTVLAYQGVLTLAATQLQDVLTQSMTNEITATGGVMILGIGITLLEIRRIPVASFIPAVFIAPLLALLASWGQI